MSMYDKLTAFWERQQNVGIEDSHLFEEKIKLQTSTGIILLGMISNACKGLFSVLAGFTPIHHYIPLTWFIIFFIGYLFIITKKRNIGVGITMFLSLTFIFILHILMGQRFVVEPLYAMFLYTIILFFDRRVQNILFATAFITYFTGIGINLVHTPMYADAIHPKYQLSHFTDNIIFFYYVVRRTLSINSLNKGDLRDQEQQLVENNEQINRFNNVVSSNLKQPTIAILKLAEELDRNKDDDFKVKDLSQSIVQSGHYLNEVVEEVKKFQQVNETEVHREMVLLDTVIEIAKRDLKGICKQRNATITYEPFPKIITDKYLIVTAIKEICMKGIMLNSKENPNIYLWGEVQLDTIKIYARYSNTQLQSQEHTQSSKNTFISIISEKIAEKLNGSIEVTDYTKYGGTTIELTLPHLKTEAILLPS